MVAFLCKSEIYNNKLHEQSKTLIESGNNLGKLVSAFEFMNKCVKY